MRIILGAMTLFAMSCGAAQAGMWEAFQTRCLTPFESFAEVKVSDLETDLEATQIGASAYKLDGLSAHLILQVEPDDGRRACLVTARQSDLADGGEAEITLFGTWQNTQTLADRYTSERYVQGDDFTIELTSTLWIEPVIRVSLRVEAGQVTMRIVETEEET